MSSIKLIYIAICYSLCYSICYNLSIVSAASPTNEETPEQALADFNKYAANEAELRLWITQRLLEQPNLSGEIVISNPSTKSRSMGDNQVFTDENNILSEVSGLVGLGVNLLPLTNDKNTKSTSEKNNLTVAILEKNKNNPEKVFKFLQKLTLNTTFTPIERPISIEENISQSKVEKNPVKVRTIADVIEVFLKSDKINHYGYFNTTFPKLKTQELTNKVIRMENIIDIYTSKQHQIEIEMKKEQANGFVHCLQEIESQIRDVILKNCDYCALVKRKEEIAASICQTIAEYDPKIVSACLDRDDKTNINGIPIAIRPFLTMIIGNYICYAPGYVSVNDRIAFAKSVISHIEALESLDSHKE